MKTRVLRFAKIAGILTLFALLAGLAVWAFGPMIYRFPDAEFAARQPSRVFMDRHGEVIRAELASDEQWRLEVTMEAVSPHVPTAFIALEDKRFYLHGGIDLVAILRAMVSNAGAGRIVTPCAHVFCRPCLSTWYNEGKKQCPLCRRGLRTFGRANGLYQES